MEEGEVKKLKPQRALCIWCEKTYEVAKSDSRLPHLFCSKKCEDEAPTGA